MSIKVKAIEWIPATGYDYTDGLPYQYEVWDDGVVRYRRHNTGKYYEAHYGNIEDAKRFCWLHHIDQVIKLIEP